MSEESEIKLYPFKVYISAYETVEIQIPCRWDGYDWILTPEAHDLIDITKIRNGHYPPRGVPCAYCGKLIQEGDPAKDPWIWPERGVVTLCWTCSSDRIVTLPDGSFLEVPNGDTLLINHMGKDWDFLEVRRLGDPGHDEWLKLFKQ